MNNLYKDLAKIQQSLKAPKGQYNSFGKYKYRSCEDILEAVKPLLGEVALLVSDEPVLIGQRTYIKSTATLSNGTDSISNIAYAREPEDKKGMDDSQITGATSSYARKYALNGLFAIDDTKDADAMDNRSSIKKEKLTQTSPRWSGAIEALKTGKCTIDYITSKFDVTENDLVLLEEVQSA